MRLSKKKKDQEGLQEFYRNEIKGMPQTEPKTPNNQRKREKETDPGRNAAQRTGKKEVCTF